MAAAGAVEGARRESRCRVMTKLPECPDRDIFRPGWAGHIAVTFNRTVAPRSKTTIRGRWPRLLGFDHMAPNSFLVAPDTCAADAFEILGLYFDGNMELCPTRAAGFTGDERLLFNWCAFGARMELVVRNDSDAPQRMIALVSGPARLTEANWKIHEAERKARNAVRWKARGAEVRARKGARGAPPAKK